MATIREEKYASPEARADAAAGAGFEAGLDDSILGAHRTETSRMIASGIAHDLNNILTAISGYSTLAMRALGEGDHAARAAIEEVERAADRAEALARQLVETGRVAPPREEPLSLSKILVEMSGMLEWIAGPAVCVLQRLEPRLAPVVANRHDVEQVVLNLAINARDAMPDGGELRFETSNSCADAGAGATGANASWVVLTVSDTGVGMDEATRARIFEPFFTTKERGKGSGLGLASVARAVRERGGRIEVETAPQAGTTFRIVLPAVRRYFTQDGTP